MNYPMYVGAYRFCTVTCMTLLLLVMSIPIENLTLLEVT